MKSLNSLIRRLNTEYMYVKCPILRSIHRILLSIFVERWTTPPIVSPIDSYSLATVLSPRSTHLALIFYQFRRTEYAVHRLLGDVRSQGNPKSALQDVRFRVPISVYFCCLNRSWGLPFQDLLRKLNLNFFCRKGLDNGIQIHV